MSASQISPTPKIKSDSPLFRPVREEKSDLLKEKGKSGAVHSVTLQEYWDHYYEYEDVAYEWNHGILEEKPTTDYDSLAQYYWFFRLLREYLRAHPIAQLTGLGLGVELEDSVRKPDNGLILNINPIPFQSGDSSYKGVCDLCIESLSPANSEGIKRDTKTKKKEYAKNGVTEYYILDYRHQETVFYRLNPTSKRYKKIPLAKKDIICSKVLPGFCFRLSDLRKMTPLQSLAGDPVYSSYVLLEYQAEKLRADQATQRAEEAKQRADQETQRAEEAKQKADQAAKQRADQAAQRAEEAKQRADQATQKAEEAKQKADQETQRAEETDQRANQAQKNREEVEQKIQKWEKEKQFSGEKFKLQGEMDSLEKLFQSGILQTSQYETLLHPLKKKYKALFSSSEESIQ